MTPAQAEFLAHLLDEPGTQLEQESWPPPYFTIPIMYTLQRISRKFKEWSVPIYRDRHTVWSNTPIDTPLITKQMLTGYVCSIHPLTFFPFNISISCSSSLF